MSTPPVPDPEAAVRRGALVCVYETQTRWRFARVKRMRGLEIDVSFFGDTSTYTVPRNDIASVEEFFEARSRVFSVERTKLTELFYGQALERLRSEKSGKMQQELRRAGIGFEPREWPSARTRIRMWRDAPPIRKAGGIDRDLAALLPQWIAPFVLPSGSRDPLGLQGPAEQLVNEVLPGLTVFTYRAGYYGFLTWAIRHVNSLTAAELPARKSRRDAVDALERALALCEFLYHGQGDDTCRLLGQHSKPRLLEAHEGGSYQAPHSILRNQHNTGCYALFGTSLVSVGLVERDSEAAATGHLPYKLTKLGETLAKTFDDRVEPEFVRFALHGDGKRRETLMRWGSALCLSAVACGRPYRRLLIDGLFFGKSEEAGKRYASVRKLFDAELLVHADATDDERAADSAPSENDATLLEDETPAFGVANLDVVLHYYRRAATPEETPLQTLATFELLAVGMSAVFGAVLHAVGVGRADLRRVTADIVSAAPDPSVLKQPMLQAPLISAGQLAKQLLQDDLSEAEAAAIGAMLLARILRDPLLRKLKGRLAAAAPDHIALLEHCLLGRMAESFESVLPDLLKALAEQHSMVAKRKSRQTWIVLEGESLVRDDMHEMGINLHALRFPQLASLARDLKLKPKDLNRD